MVVPWAALARDRDACVIEWRIRTELAVESSGNALLQSCFELACFKPNAYPPLPLADLVLSAPKLEEHLAEQNPVCRRVQFMLRHLEAHAPAPAASSFPHSSRYLRPVGPQRTRKILQTSAILPPGLVKSLDPDAMFRQQRQIHQFDRDTESTFLHEIWQLIRQGKRQEAVSRCMQSDQQWRALSLAGGLPWSYEQSEHVLSNGNPRQQLYKKMCRTIAEDTNVSRWEKGIYGVLGDRAFHAEAACSNVQDILWTYLSEFYGKAMEFRKKAFFEHHSDLRDLYTACTLPDVTVSDPCLTTLFENIYMALARTCQSDPSYSASLLYVRVLELLLGGDTEALLREMGKRVQLDAPGEYRMLAAWTTIYIMQHTATQLHGSSLNQAQRIVTAYLEAKEPREEEFATFFAMFVPSDKQVEIVCAQMDDPVNVGNHLQSLETEFAHHDKTLHTEAIMAVLMSDAIQAYLQSDEEQLHVLLAYFTSWLKNDMPQSEAVVQTLVSGFQALYADRMFEEGYLLTQNMVFDGESCIVLLGWQSLFGLLGKVMEMTELQHAMEERGKTSETTPEYSHLRDLDELDDLEEDAIRHLDQMMICLYDTSFTETVTMALVAEVLLGIHADAQHLNRFKLCAHATRCIADPHSRVYTALESHTIHHLIQSAACLQMNTLSC